VANLRKGTYVLAGGESPEVCNDWNRGATLHTGLYQKSILIQIKTNLCG